MCTPAESAHALAPPQTGPVGPGPYTLTVSCGLRTEQNRQFQTTNESDACSVAKDLVLAFEGKAELSHGNLGELMPA